MAGSYKPGELFQAIGKSSAMKTDLWTKTDRTITYADHASILSGEIVLLVEYHDMGDAGIYIWLWGDRVVWQVLKDDAFAQCWKLIVLENL